MRAYGEYGYKCALPNWRRATPTLYFMGVYYTRYIEYQWDYGISFRYLKPTDYIFDI